jgi:hypothetical protein
MIFEILDRHDWLGATLRAIGGHMYRKGSIAYFLLATWKRLLPPAAYGIVALGWIGVTANGKGGILSPGKIQGLFSCHPCGGGEMGYSMNYLTSLTSSFFL